MDFGMKQGDVGTPISAVLKDAQNKPVDLTGATVKFLMAKTTGTDIYSDGVVQWDIIVDSPAEVFYPEGGIVQYIFKADDVAEFGQFVGEFQVTHASGHIETFPNSNTQIKISIHPDIR